MSKRKPNIKHSVRANMQVIELSKAGSSMELEVFSAKEKIGTVIIGRGSITWISKNKQKGRRLSWTRFASLME